MTLIRNLASTALALLLLTTAAHAADAKFEAGSYQLDPAHSKVGFEVTHLVISTVEGRFTKFDGSLDLAEPFDKSTVAVNVDTTSVDTGNGKRDDHLKSADFFDTAKFPTMTFNGTEIKGTPASFTLTGDLTIHGITKKVTFDAKYLGTVGDGHGNQKAAFQATARIKRKDFGLTWNSLVEAGPVVGDDVTLDLRVQAAKPLVKKS